MRQFLRVLLFATVAGISSIAVAAEPVSGEERAEQVATRKVGQPAPALHLTTIDGNAIDLAALYGKKAIYLKFWATWCHDCREQMPHFEKTFQNAGDGLTVVGVNVGFNDTLADVRSFQREYGLTMPLVIDDGRVAAAFDLRVTPMHVVIGRDGRIRYVGHLAGVKLDRALTEAQRPATPVKTAHKVSAQISAQMSKVRTLAIGDRIAPFVVRPINSTRTVQIAAAKSGKPTIVAFIAAWCEWYLSETRAAVADQCRRTREQLTTASAQYGEQANWVWIASGLWTTPDDLRLFTSKYRIDAPIHLDEHGELFNRFDVHAVPTIVVLDGEGVMRERISGNAERVGATLAQYLR